MAELAQILKFPETVKRVRADSVVSIPSFSAPVSAGTPSEMPEGFSDYAAEYIDLNQELVRNPAQTIIVTVKGNSMEPLLQDGDQVIVDKSLENYCNNMCVVYLNGNPTVKWVKKIKSKYFLVPENTLEHKTSELKFDDGLNNGIAGVVTGKFRNFKVRF